MIKKLKKQIFPFKRKDRFVKIRENIFLEEAVYCYDEEGYNYAKEFIEKQSQELQDKIKEEISDEQGMICQRFYDVSSQGHNDYIEVNLRTHRAICSKEYFKEGIFKDYINMKSRARADIGINHFNEYQQPEYPNIKITDNQQEFYYLDKKGNLVAKSLEEFNSLVNN